MEAARHPFPISSTARTIGEEKAKVKSIVAGVGQFGSFGRYNPREIRTNRAVEQLC
jgi:topoisomerase IA-like protein